MNWPLISICIPAYNSRPFIEKSVVSALSQDYPNYEVVICDDNTTDGTWDYLNNIKDPKVRIFRNPVNLGNHGNHNQTVFHAKGEFIKFLHDDDELDNNTLSYMVSWLLQYPNVVATVVHTTFIDENSQICGHSPSVINPLLVKGIDNLHIMPLWGNQIGCTGNIMLRKEIYQAVGGMDKKMKYFAELELFGKLSTIGDWIHLPGARYRYRGGNVTSLSYSLKKNDNRIDSFKELLDIAEIYGHILGAYSLSPKEVKQWQAKICSEGLQSGLSYLMRHGQKALLKQVILQIKNRGIKAMTIWHAITKTLPRSTRYSFHRRVTGCAFNKGEIIKLAGTELTRQK